MQCRTHPGECETAYDERDEGEVYEQYGVGSESGHLFSANSNALEHTA